MPGRSLLAGPHKKQVFDLRVKMCLLGVRRDGQGSGREQQVRIGWNTSFWLLSFSHCDELVSVFLFSFLCFEEVYQLMLAPFVGNFVLFQAELFQSHRLIERREHPPDDHCPQNISRLDLQGQNSSRSTGTSIPGSSKITFPFQPLLQNVSMILLSYAGNHLDVPCNRTWSLKAQEICAFALIPCCWWEKASNSGFIFPQTGHHQHYPNE